MSVEDLRLLNTGQQDWLYLNEVQRVHRFKRQVEIGWRLSVSQRGEVERMVTESRARRRTALHATP